MSKHQLLNKYTDLYRKLYNREPKSVQQISSDFVVVNGMQMRFRDLEMLTHQLEKEYLAAQKQKRSAILKLVDWFRR